MVISYATNSQDVYLAVTGTMTAEICEILNLMVNLATATTLQKPQTNLTDLSFAASDEEITNSSLNNKQLPLLRLIKTKFGPPLRQ